MSEERKIRPIRMSDEEWELAGEGADLAGLSSNSEYVRWAVRQTTLKLRSTSERFNIVSERSEAGSGAGSSGAGTKADD